ncbi:MULTISPECIES: cobalamin-dependent protein [unclassified Streptomyces]|uniref:cobalamin-dependent protein n=1 Tax=unclassified Streptomyces TaxID=2593676 RepID=UPI0036E2ED70
MKVCLISPPTVTEYQDASVAENRTMKTVSENVPLGVLSLAAVLEQQGRQPIVVDLNRWYQEFLHTRNSDAERPARTPGDFSAFAAERITSLPADVYGFSTICSSYPLTLRIAESIKQAKPHAAIILGGPQASVVDVPSMRV